MKKYVCDINTIRWYNEYQRLILRIPTHGTANTNAWYCEYQRMVLRIPTHGTASTKCWYEFGTENLKTIGQGKQRHFLKFHCGKLCG